jgi:peptidoglycan/LPS O-acetylase OafA/YrhL
MSKILPLQSLRGILCMLVVIVHFTPYEILKLHNHFLAGIAVIGFFILSGYVLTLNYNNKIYDIDGLKIFIKKRFLRLYPLHFFFLIIFIILEYLKYFINLNFNLEINSQIFLENNIYSALTNLLLINTLNDYLSFNSPSWAVSAEFLSSIIFGLFLLIFKKYFFYFSILIFIFFLFYFMRLELSFIQYNGLFSLYSCIACYCLGTIVYFLNEKKFLNKIINNYFFQIANLFTFILLIKSNNYLTIIILFNISFLILFLVNLEIKNHIFAILSNKYLVYLGNISYSIYLSHYFVYWVVTQIFRHLLKFEIINSYTDTIFIVENYSIYLIKFIISIVITLVISKYLYKLIEKKFEYKNYDQKKIYTK